MKIDLKEFIWLYNYVIEKEKYNFLFYDTES